LRNSFWCAPERTTERNKRVVNPMAKLSDEERRALAVLSRHPEGCDEAVLLTDGFTVRQLAGFVIDGFATGSAAGITLDGREKPVVWMTISDAGRKAIAD
jgi:hypothetical protein